MTTINVKSFSMMRAIIAALLTLPPVVGHAQQAAWLWWGTNTNTTVPVSVSNPLPVTPIGGGTGMLTNGSNSTSAALQALATNAGAADLALGGALTATTFNKITITGPATSGTLTIADGKTLTDTSSVGAVALKGATGGGFGQAACADLSNGATGCSTATGTSGATIPLLNGTNTWSGVQTFSAGDLKVAGAGAGVATFAYQNTASNVTTTLPALTGTVAITGVANNQTFGASSVSASTPVIISNTNSNAASSAAIPFTNSTGTEGSITLNGGSFSGGNGANAFQVNGVAGLYFQTNSTNAISIDTSQKATFAGQIVAANMTQSSAAQSGTVCFAAAGLTYDATLGCLASSRNLKDRIVPLNGSLKTVLALDPSSFYFKPEYAAGREGQQIGLIAEQVAAVDKRLVGYGDDGSPRGWNQSAVIAELVGAVKEQQAEIAELRTLVKRN